MNSNYELLIFHFRIRFVSVCMILCVLFPSVAVLDTLKQMYSLHEEARGGLSPPRF